VRAFQASDEPRPLIFVFHMEACPMRFPREVRE
jgi:hypothetical protein